MELKTDKIHRILNTPYDELSPQDFAEAQDQLEALRWREHAVTVENLETALALTKAERDQFKGICERFKREIEDIGHTCLTCGRPVHPNRVREWRMTGAAPCHHGREPGTPTARAAHEARVADLERMAKTDAEVIANLTKERDQLDDELTELRQAPSGTATQAKRIRELEDKLASSIDPAYHAKLAAELEQAKAQAANSDTMARGLAAECDAAQQRELKALRQLADLVEREAFYGCPRDKAASAFAKFAAEETAAAHEAMDKLEAELHKYGYGRPPGTPPTEVTGLAGFLKEVIKDKMTEEPHPFSLHELLKPEPPVATSIDSGQSWWCPKCQASIIPGVPHVCPVLTCRRCGSSVLDGKDHGVGACPGDSMP